MKVAKKSLGQYKFCTALFCLLMSFIWILNNYVYQSYAINDPFDPLYGKNSTETTVTAVNGAIEENNPNASSTTKAEDDSTSKSTSTTSRKTRKVIEIFDTLMYCLGFILAAIPLCLLMIIGLARTNEFFNVLLSKLLAVLHSNLGEVKLTTLFIRSVLVGIVGVFYLTGEMKILIAKGWDLFLKLF